ncbi:MAG: hypothetical protein JWQ71_2407 [Pedosphaera sp.]|nr:hypothetical protein [Pedosphaera sp.]
MKVLIQDQETLMYLAHQSGWTDQPSEAKDLAFTVHAHHVAKSLALKSFHILFYFPGSEYQMVVSECESSPSTTSKA